MPRRRRRLITASTPNTLAIRSGVSTSRGAALGNQSSAIHHHDAVGKARGERQVVHDREHGAAVMRSMREELHHHELVARIERRRRLVGEQYRRFGRERARKRDARPLAAGQRRDRPRRKRLHRGRRERPRNGGAVSSVSGEKRRHEA